MTLSGKLGSSSRPVRIAIVGAGPSGFYAAGALLQQKDAHVAIDLFDRLPTPYGLVRYGVAPDHQKIKSVTRIYERTMKDGRVRYFGNVNLGSDITHAELKSFYDQIVYAVGAQSDKKLGIPGEDLTGSFSATEFVAWYNGHPDFRHYQFDLNVENVAVIGVGNVAMDVTRILAKSVAELKTTDITDYALEELAESKVKRIHIFARRGPVQAKFTNPEIKELGELEIADVIINPDDLILDEASQAEMEGDRTAQRNIQTLQMLAERGATGKPKQIIFHFLRSPTEIFGEAGAVNAMTTEKNALQESETWVYCLPRDWFFTPSMTSAWCSVPSVTGASRFRVFRFMTDGALFPMRRGVLRTTTAVRSCQGNTLSAGPNGAPPASSAQTSPTLSKP